MAERPEHRGVSAEAGLRLVVGLGNPGARYLRTRHNLGFRLIDRLEAESRVRPAAGAGNFTISRTAFEGTPVALVRPLTWMNRSGTAVEQLRRIWPEAPLLVAVDDVALPLGTLRLRPRGSHGGHNGLRSIEERLGNGDFARLRLGCGPAPEEADLADFVLGEFAPEEEEEVVELLDRAAQAVRCWVLEGPEVAMSRFNGPASRGAPDERAGDGPRIPRE